MPGTQVRRRAGEARSPATPWFVTLLAYVLFAMALVLSGVLAVSGWLAGLGQGLPARGGYTGSFSWERQVLRLSPSMNRVFCR